MCAWADPADCSRPDRREPRGPAPRSAAMNSGPLPERRWLGARPCSRRISSSTLTTPLDRNARAARRARSSRLCSSMTTNHRNRCRPTHCSLMRSTAQMSWRVVARCCGEALARLAFFGTFRRHRVDHVRGARYPHSRNQFLQNSRGRASIAPAMQRSRAEVVRGRCRRMMDLSHAQNISMGLRSGE